MVLEGGGEILEGGVRDGDVGTGGEILEGGVRDERLVLEVRC